MNGYYTVIVLRGGLVHDRQWHDASDINITTYIHEMLAHGYRLEIEFHEVAE